MPRFVILEHDHPHRHWDLMLEVGNVLRTWRLAEPPEGGKTVAAEALGDHRRVYLDYEGPVSGERGYVKRWDWGTYQGDLRGADIEIFLVGVRLKGQLFLRRSTAGTWSFRIVCAEEESSPLSEPEA